MKPLPRRRELIMVCGPRKEPAAPARAADRIVTRVGARRGIRVRALHTGWTFAIKCRHAATAG